MIPSVAIQIDDLLSLKATPGSEVPFLILMRDFVTTASPVVMVDNHAFDGAAVVVDGPAAGDDERVAGLVDLLITVLGPRKLKRRVRIYQQGPRGGWNPVRKMDDLRRPEEVIQ